MTISSLTQLLGGKKALGQEVRTRMDLIDLSRKGVSKASLLHLAKFMGLPVRKMAVLLPVTERTIQRYAPRSTSTGLFRSTSSTSLKSSPGAWRFSKTLTGL